MVRRIILWMGLSVLILPLCLFSEANAQQKHKVKAGETLTSIAAHYNLEVSTLRKLNKLKGDKITANQVLILAEKAPQAPKNPANNKRKVDKTQNSRTTHVVKPGETLISIARKTNTSVEEIRQLNNLKNDRITVGKKLIIARTTPNNQDQLPTADLSLSLEEEGDGDILPDDALAAIERDKREASELLGKWRSPQERASLITAASLFLGAPYRLGGESVRGIDCSAFVRSIYSIFGINLPRTAREQSYIGLVVSRDNLKEGDLVFFNTRRAFGHVGIYIGDNKFLHASYRSKAVKIDSMDSPYFQKRFVRAVRLKDLEGEGL